MKHLFLLLFTSSIFAQVTLFKKADKDALNSLTSASNTTQIFESSNNVGISTPTPLNKLHITGGNANTGGIRLPITSASGAQTGQPIGVNANGDIVRLANATFDATVSFSTVTPTTAGVVFTPNTPASTNVLYVSNVNGSQWTYNGTTYLSEPVSNDWKTAGNSATVEATNFIGTTDNIGLSFRTNNVIRQTITNAGNVGIGTNFASSRLTVNGAVQSVAGTTINTQGAFVLWNRTNGDGATWLINQKGGGNGGIIFGTSTNANVVTEHARILEGGNFGIGTGSPSTRLHVIGSILATGTITPSDKRLKRNIKNITYTIKDINKLVPVSYIKKFSLDENEKGEVNEIGFIAQDLQKVIPEIVVEGKDKDKILALNYTSIIPILVKCMQDQQKEIEILKSKIK